jgi:hypothetical protein
VAAPRAGILTRAWVLLAGIETAMLAVVVCLQGLSPGGLAAASAMVWPVAFAVQTIRLSRPAPPPGAHARPRGQLTSPTRPGR